MEKLMGGWRWLRRRYPRVAFGLKGALAGAIFGVFFGGIGLAARGGAVPLSGAVAFGVIGWLAADYFYQWRSSKTR